MNIMSASQIIAKAISDIGYRYSTYQVFSDFVEAAAISIYQAMSFDEALEQRYMQIVKQYDKAIFEQFPELLGYVMLEALEVGKSAGPIDILGSAFETLGLSNKHTGQYFTPQQVCDAMGLMVLDDNCREQIAQKGYISVLEPACGSGRMIYGICKAFKKAGYDYTKQMVVQAIDIDPRAVHMTYVQMALYGIPGVVVYGNALSCEEYRRWYTPAYVQGEWHQKEAA